MEPGRRIQDIVVGPRRPSVVRSASPPDMRGRRPIARRLKLPSEKQFKLLGTALLALILLQVIYPRNTALPFSRLDGRSVSINSMSEVEKIVEDSAHDQSLKLRVGEKTYDLKPEDAGLKISASKTAKEATDYKFKWRLIPFSIFGGLFQNHGYLLESDEQKLADFAAKFETENHRSAQNANLRIEGDKVILDEEKSGTAYPKNSVVSQLVGLKLKKDHEYSVKGETENAKRTTELVRPVAEAAEKMIDSGLTLIVDEEKSKPAKTEIASWLKFDEDSSTLELRIGFKDDALTNYLNTLNSKVYVAPVDTKVTYVDGEETKRVEGKPGRGLDLTKTKELIQAALTGDTSKELELAIVDVQPQVVPDSKYTRDAAGLQAVIEDAIAAQNGDFKVKVQELGSRGWSGGVRTNEKTTPASTYKLFVAWLVLQKVDSKDWSLSDNILSGQNLSECLEDMIVNSDNDCAVAFGTKLGGWKEVDAVVKNAGYKNTDYAPEFKSTVQDQATFLIKLYRGELISSESTNRLLGLMKRQRFREGVPAGTKTDVADKVGFLYGYLHDSAIVYSPSGDYVVVIYSDNSSWADIAVIARKIHLFLNGRY